jgi:hypothetical protein
MQRIFRVAGLTTIGMFLKHNSKLQIKLVYGAGEKIISDMRNNLVDVVILPDLKSEYGISGSRKAISFP